MPSAPLKPCPTPGCGVLGPCPTHAERRVDRQPWRAWYFIGRWRHPIWGMRAKVLRDNPLCVICQMEGRAEPAVDIDHIQPHHGDPFLFWARSNLQGLCKQHHSEKTRTGA